MDKKAWLRKIWALERMERPGLFLEETPDGQGYVDFGSGEVPVATVFAKAQQDADTLVRGRDDGVPVVNVGLGSHVIATAFGCKERVFEDGHKYLAGPVIHSSSDVDRMKVPKVLNGILGKQIELLKYAADHCDDTYDIRIGDIQNPLGVAEMIWESDSFYASLLDEPEQVHKLLDMITELILEYVGMVKNYCRNLTPIAWPVIWAPSDKGVYLADDTMSMVSPDMYEEFGVQYNNRIGRAFGGVMLHSCIMKQPYFASIMKNEGLRSVNFAAQYSSDMKDIFGFFGGKAVILPHYYHTDSPQIGTVTEFIAKVAECWSPETPTIIYVGRKPEGGSQQEVIEAFRSHWPH